MHDPLSILMLSIEYPPVGGGASPVTRGLARALVQRGHRVDVVTMAHGTLPADESDEGVRVLRVPSFRARLERSRVHELAAYTISARSRIRALAAECRYDACHAHFVLPTGWVPFALRRRARLSALRDHGARHRRARTQSAPFHPAAPRHPADHPPDSPPRRGPDRAVRGPGAARPEPASTTCCLRSPGSRTR